MDEDPDPRPCPFCEGAEALTPPESYAQRPAGTAPDGPGWLVRVVPNKYPAFSGELGRQEVVVHVPRHAKSLAELTVEELHLVAVALGQRAQAAAEVGFGYLHAFGNEGRAAGASLGHTHSQLVWLPEPPPAVARERPSHARRCPVCALVRDRVDLVVERRDGVVLVCPYASRVPFELLVAPEQCEAHAFESESLAAALALLTSGIARLRRAIGPVALNWWIHTSRFGAAAGHWHLEIVPRTTVSAGLELGAELYVNSLAPEDAAAELRRP